MSRFSISPSAPRLDIDEIQVLTRKEIDQITPHMELICESISDNDRETWFLTRGGNFIRETAGVVFATDIEFAFEFLNDWAAEDVMDELVNVNAFEGLSRTPMP